MTEQTVDIKKHRHAMHATSKAIVYAFTTDIRPSLVVHGKARHRLIFSNVKECDHVRLRLRRQA